jgi:hypothetical protein
VGHSGVNFVTNWTWSHALDNLSDTFSTSDNDVNLGYLDPFDPKLDKGPAQFDNRHRIAIGGIWAVPFFDKTHGAVKEVLDGWSFAPIITARTGSPYTIFDETNDFFYAPRLMQTSTPIPRNPQPAQAIPGLPDTYSILNECSNITTFTGCLYNSSYVNPIVGYSDWGPFPSSMTQRDAFRNPGAWNIDFGIHKSFKITERVNLEMRGEMFNLCNHANLYNTYVPNGNGLGTGGTGTSYGSGLVIGSGGAPYIPAYFTGHRNVQLAARVTF